MQAVRIRSSTSQRQRGRFRWTCRRHEDVACPSRTTFIQCSPQLKQNVPARHSRRHEDPPYADAFRKLNSSYAQYGATQNSLLVASICANVMPPGAERSFSKVSTSPRTLGSSWMEFGLWSRPMAPASTRLWVLAVPGCQRQKCRTTRDDTSDTPRQAAQTHPAAVAGQCCHEALGCASKLPWRPGILRTCIVAIVSVTFACPQAWFVSMMCAHAE